MKKIKRILRLIFLACIIGLACVGFVVAPVTSSKRDNYLDNEVKTEMVESNEEEGEATEKGETPD